MYTMKPNKHISTYTGQIIVFDDMAIGLYSLYRKEVIILTMQNIPNKIYHYACSQENEIITLYFEPPSKISS